MTHWTGRDETTLTLTTFAAPSRRRVSAFGRPCGADMTAPTNDYRFSDQVGHLLRRAYQRHVAIFQAAVPDSRLTAAQFVVLCAVRDRGGCDVRAVVEATAMDEASVRGIVERLKIRELLTATHEPGDARHVDLALTPAGTALVEQTVPFARQISETTFGDLDAGERAELVRLLSRISGGSSDSERGRPQATGA